MQRSLFESNLENAGQGNLRGRRNNYPDLSFPSKLLSGFPMVELKRKPEDKEADVSLLGQKAR